MVVVTRDEAGEDATREIGRIDVGDALSTNFTATERAEAVGLEGGDVLIWR